MNAGLFDQGSIPILEKAIAFAQLRQRLIANNIANADTPFYTAKDLPVDEFQQLLNEAIERREAAPQEPFELGSSSNITVNDLGQLVARSVESTDTGALRHDENNVSIDIEMAKLSANVLFHNALIEIMRKQFEMLQAAISERLA